jgi:hypothetical protein
MIVLAACPAHPGSLAYRQIVVWLICVGGYADSYSMLVRKALDQTRRFLPQRDSQYRFPYKFRFRSRS